MKDTSTWALAIRARRIDAGMTREALAEACGVRPSTIGSWERGRTEPDAVRKSLLLTAAGVGSDEEYLVAAEGADPKATLAPVGGRPRNDPGVPFVGRSLKLWRVAGGFTQAVLAAASGVPTSTICDLERGVRLPTQDVLSRLAATLGREVEDFAAEPTLTRGEA